MHRKVPAGPDPGGGSHIEKGTAFRSVKTNTVLHRARPIVKHTDFLT